MTRVHILSINRTEPGGPSRGTEPVVEQGKPSLAVTLEIIMDELNNMEIQQDSVQNMFESTIDTLKADLMAGIDLKIKSVTDDIQLEFDELRAMYDSLKHDFETLKGQVNIDHSCHKGAALTHWKIPRDALSCLICGWMKKGLCWSKCRLWLVVLVIKSMLM